MKKSARRSRRYIAVLTAAAFSTLSVSCGMAELSEMVGMNTASTAVVERQDVINSINVSGNVEGGSIVKVTSTLNQKVKTLNAELGSYVQAGEVLCIFDSTELQKEYDDLLKSMENAQAMQAKNDEINQRNLENAKSEKQTALAQAQRAVDEAIAARDNAYSRYNAMVGECNTLAARAGELYQALSAAADEEELAMLTAQYQEVQVQQQTVSAEMEVLNSQLSSYDSAIQAAQDAYAAAERSADSMIQSMQDTIDVGAFNTDNSTEAQLEKLEEMIAACTVKAPKSGIITALNVAEGSIPTAEALMTIEDNHSLKITVKISEADILRIQEGQRVIIKTTATGDQEINGSVSRVVNILNAEAAAMGEAGYTAEIQIDDPDTGLLIGMSAKARIILEETKDTLAVPYDAITENEDGEPIVYLAREAEDGTYTAESVPVELGIESDYYTEIFSSEVNEGDIVILSAEHMLEGETITIDDDSADVDSEE